MNIFLHIITANALKQIPLDIEIINSKETDHKLVVDFHADTVMTIITASIIRQIEDVIKVNMSYTADKEIFDLPGGYKIVVDKKYKTLTATIDKCDEKDFMSFMKNICKLGDVNIIDNSTITSISNMLCKIEGNKPLNIKHAVKSTQENIQIISTYNLGYVKIQSHIGDNTVVRISF